MPVLNVNDYVLGYANLSYDTTVARSTDFNAAIPSKLGNAKATDTASAFYTGDGGIGAWSNVVNGGRKVRRGHGCDGAVEKCSTFINHEACIALWKTGQT